ncbi:MAG: hypothetical protein KDA36_02585 [Planctomycetaceae bacterium]|nr:hypothetical protein [Planctomycetaceae bacterium]
MIEIPNMEDARSNPTGAIIVKGTFASILLAGALVVLGILIPPRWKLFGIYPLVLGGVLGLGLQRFHGSSLRPKWLVVVLVFLLPVIIWNAQHFWLHRQYASVLQKSFDADPTRDWGLDQIPSSEKDESDADRQMREDFQKELARIERIRSEKVSFEGYLLARVRPLGISSTSGAWCVYVFETALMIAGSCGISVFRRSIRKPDSSQEGPSNESTPSLPNHDYCHSPNVVTTVLDDGIFRP